MFARPCFAIWTPYRNTYAELNRVNRKIDAMEAHMDEKFVAMDEKFVAMDEKFVAMDEKFVAMDEKFVAMDAKFDTKFDQLFALLAQKFPLSG